MTEPLRLVHRGRQHFRFLWGGALTYVGPKPPFKLEDAYLSVVEALRMVAEGQEKTTGTERLDGLWGYERRLPVARADAILTVMEG